MYCKTYSGDLERFKLMVESFELYNRENIKLYVSVPQKEEDLFKKFEAPNITVMTDESYAEKYFAKEEYHNLPLGYINQEICKLCFWKTGISENYLCIDADLLFIRDFYINDFMADENTPYTVLVMDKDLSIERHYQDFWKQRQKWVADIYTEAGLDDLRLRTCHGMQVLNAKVLASLENDFMKSKGYAYADLVRIAPLEFTWYNVWFQKCGLVKEVAVEPFFKTFHMRIEYIFSLLRQIRKSDLAKAYAGIILNGNWDVPADNYETPSWIFKKIYKWLKRK